jgi:hypothetical protein
MVGQRWTEASAPQPRATATTSRKWATPVRSIRIQNAPSACEVAHTRSRWRRRRYELPDADSSHTLPHTGPAPSPQSLGSQGAMAGSGPGLGFAVATLHCYPEDFGHIGIRHYSHAGKSGNSRSSGRGGRRCLLRYMDAAAAAVVVVCHSSATRVQNSRST